MLAQVWGLSLGMTSAYAAATDPGTDLVSRSEAPALLEQLTGTVPLLEHQAAPVGRVLQERIRSGGLPLPGQATTVPDAFAIAAVLLPSVPPQPRGDDAQRASRSLPGGTGEARKPTGLTASASGGASADGSDRAHPAVNGQQPPGVGGPGGSGQASPLVPADQLTGQDPGAQDLTLTSAAPVGGGDDFTAVLVPITAGLLLTGAAMYKHRGLPRGH